MSILPPRDDPTLPKSPCHREPGAEAKKQEPLLGSSGTFDHWGQTQTLSSLGDGAPEWGRGWPRRTTRRVSRCTGRELEPAGTPSGTPGWVESVFLVTSEENKMAEGSTSPGRGRARVLEGLGAGPGCLHRHIQSPRHSRCEEDAFVSHKTFRFPTFFINLFWYDLFKKNLDCRSLQHQCLDLWTSRSRPCAAPQGPSVIGLDRCHRAPARPSW